MPSTSGTKDIPQEKGIPAKEVTTSSETSSVQSEPSIEKPKPKANIHHQPKQMRNQKRQRNQRYRKNLSERKQFWQSQNAYFSHQDKNLKYKKNPVEMHENNSNRKQRFGSEKETNRKQRFGSEIKRDQNSKVSPTNDQKQKGHLESPAKKSSQSKPSQSHSSTSSNSSNSSSPHSKFHSVPSRKSQSSAEQKGKQKVSVSKSESKPNAPNPNKSKFLPSKRKMKQH